LEGREYCFISWERSSHGGCGEGMNTSLKCEAAMRLCVSHPKKIVFKNFPICRVFVLILGAFDWIVVVVVVCSYCMHST
jgi:hypothetical protein